MDLLAAPTLADLARVRRLAREEIDRRRAADDGCGDALLGLCFLLYLIGDAADVLLIDEAKHVNFDAGCTVDSDLYRMRRGCDEMLAAVRGRSRAEALVRAAFDAPNYTTPAELEAHLRGYFGIG